MSKNKGELVLSSLEGGFFGACAFDLSFIYIYMVHALNLCVPIYLLLIVIDRYKNKNKMYIKDVGSRFAADRNGVGFARKTALTISFVERGFERLGLDR